MDITQCKLAYKENVDRWAMVEAALGGTESMRAAGKKYLPQEPGESDEAYKNRLERSTFYNKFAYSVRQTAGKVFGNGFIIDKEAPQQILELLEDSDLEQRDFNQFMSDVADLAMAKGVAYVLVEHPVVEGELTVEEEKAAGVRPYCVLIDPLSLFYWESEGGKLSEIRFKEMSDDVEQIRVLTPTTWQIWRQREDSTKEWFLFSEGVMTLGVIPLVAFYARRTAFMSARPPLEDLLYLNIAHWQSSSDQRHILHVARVPILFGIGLDQDKDVEVGPNRLIQGGPGSDLKFVEHSGKGIEAGAADLKAIEEQMESLSLAPTLRVKSGSQTATAAAIDSAEAKSQLNLVRLAWQDSANIVLWLMSKWMKVDLAEGCATLPEKSAEPLTGAARIAEVSRARSIGDLSRETYLSILVDEGVLPENFDATEDQTKLETETVTV